MDTKIKIDVNKNSIPSGGNPRRESAVEYNTYFYVGEEPMKFAFNAMYMDGHREARIPKGFRTGYEVSFSRFSGGEWHFDTMSDLSTKDTLTAFSGIKKSMDMFIAALKTKGIPLDFYFSSKKKEASKKKLYDKFAKIIASKLKLKLHVSNAGNLKYYLFLENDDYWKQYKKLGFK
jgi:hypothetical protein